MFVLMGSSNNVPEIFTERIFKPIIGRGWSIHYSGLIVILGIYYCLKQLNKIRENRLITTKFGRIISIIILLSIFPAMWVQFIQFYKGFYKDLNSIYLDREKAFVDFQTNEDKIIVSGRIKIINCSNNTQKFYVEIKTPSLVKEDINEEYITLENEFEINPKEEKTLSIFKEITLDRQTQYSWYGMRAFEYILFNDKDEVIFKGTLNEYQIDKLELKENLLNVG